MDQEINNFSIKQKAKHDRSLCFQSALSHLFHFPSTVPSDSVYFGNIQCFYYSWNTHFVVWEIGIPSMTNHSVGRYIDSTIKTIHDLGLPVISVISYIDAFSHILDGNNDYSDILNLRREWVGEVGLVMFFILEVPDYESTMLIYFYIYSHGQK